jgi:UDP-N-acetylglucosamine diphosphorylase/glucosamine-1-phosphate N-acetyltransferase
MQHSEYKTAIVILAAGLGTRMKSNMAKVLHKVGEKPMIKHVVDTAAGVSKENIIVITGHQSDRVRETVASCNGIGFALQEKQLGTGHAVLCAMSEVKDNIDDILILCGDVPLLTSETVSSFIQHHKTHENILTVLAVQVDDPTGYGRMIVDDEGSLIKIVEESDATLDEKKINLINSGIYCVEKSFLKRALNLLKPDNSQEELYLTDVIFIASNEKLQIGLFIGQDADEVIGVNSLQDLKKAEQLLCRRQSKTS